MFMLKEIYKHSFVKMKFCNHYQKFWSSTLKQFTDRNQSVDNNKYK